MDKFKEIRPIVLGVAIKDGKLLVSEAYDSVKNNYFYRCLGGGIEYQETSIDALKREFKEEINIDIEVGNFLGVAENIFTYNGKKGHEIVFFYEINIPENLYQEKYIQDEDGEIGEAVWVDIKDFKNGSKILYPREIFKYL